MLMTDFGWLLWGLFGGYFGNKFVGFRVDDVELVYETVINDLRFSGYTESDIDSCLAAKTLEVGGEKGLDGKQSSVLLKRQKPSERITKTKLEKKKLLDHALHLRFLLHNVSFQIKKKPAKPALTELLYGPLSTPKET
ncbi:hypothetical protein LXL04_024580 [Taraxacum kok-saghyz]